MLRLEAIPAVRLNTAGPVVVPIVMLLAIWTVAVKTAAPVVVEIVSSFGAEVTMSAVRTAGPVVVLTVNVVAI